MTVEFDKNDEMSYDVLLTGVSENNFEPYGELKFDSEQNVWVLWPKDIDDAVSYFESLEETEKEIKDEIIAFTNGNYF